MSLRRSATALATAALAVTLAGCISVLPKSKPDQLYNFGHIPDLQGAAPPATPASARSGVLLGEVAFPRAALGDEILTVTGTQNAYVGESRWVGPASVLFREAVGEAFDRTAQRTRLLARGETGRDVLVLRIDVSDFEAVYTNGPMSPPTVLVTARARLSRPDGVAVDERTFEAKKPAVDNRVGPIVYAYDAATREVLMQLVAWTDQTVATQPAPPSSGR